MVVSPYANGKEIVRDSFWFNAGCAVWNRLVLLDRPPDYEVLVNVYQMGCDSRFKKTGTASGIQSTELI
jgi:hypothetical protein